MTATRTAYALLLAPLVAVVVLAGVWVAGGVSRRTSGRRWR